MFPPEHHATPDDPGVLPGEADAPETPALPGLADLVSQAPAAALDVREESDDWKAELRRQFEAWLGELDDIRELEPDGTEQETPDLYAFYSQWTAANAEARKANRRTAEAFSQWGDTLGRFDGDLKLLREQLQRLATAAPSEGLSRGHCLVLAELLDRLRRLSGAFAAAPASSWWGGTRLWRQAWENLGKPRIFCWDIWNPCLKRRG